MGLWGVGGVGEVFGGLPKGLFLHYEDLQGTPVFDHQGGVSFKDVTYKVKAGRAKLYGGLLAENVTQAIARIKRALSRGRGAVGAG